MAAKWEAHAAEPFDDPTRLTNWVVWSLAALAVVCLTGVATGLMERDVLLRILGGDFASDEEQQAVVHASDVRFGLQAIAEVAVFLIAGFISLKWIYRANLNARRLGARSLRYPPSLAVGYYFIPILNLWRPYRAMQEIWRASADPQHWETQKTPILFPIWWSLWIAANVLGQASFRVQTLAKEMPDLLAANGLGIASDVLAIALVIAFILVIRQIYRLQMQRNAAGPLHSLDQTVTVPS